MTLDPLDAITWVQYRAAFKIATLALVEIALGDDSAGSAAAATAGLKAMRAEVRRFDDSEPSWEPPPASLKSPGGLGPSGTAACEERQEGDG